MKIFEDVFSNDEVLSDALDIKLEYEDSIYTVVSKLVNPDDGANVDIGCGNQFGGNADEDGEAGGQGPAVEKVNNIIDGFQLEEYISSKKDMIATFKDKMKLIRERLSDNPIRLSKWEQTGIVGKFLKEEVFSKYDECKFYMGKSYGSYDPKESMLIVSFWVNNEDTGETFFFFKDCLREVKV